MRNLVIILLCALVLVAATGCCGALTPDESGKVPLQASLDAVRAANAASAPLNPWALPLEGILGTVSLVIGAYAASTKRNQMATAKKYEAHKRGVEAVMRDSQPDQADIIYEAIGDQRKKLGI